MDLFDLGVDPSEGPVYLSLRWHPKGAARVTDAIRALKPSRDKGKPPPCIAADVDRQAIRSPETAAHSRSSTGTKVVAFSAP